MQMLKDQVVNITGYSQQKSNNPKSFGKKSRNFDESLQTGVPDTLSMASTAALWLTLLACRATLKTTKFCAILH